MHRWQHAWGLLLAVRNEQNLPATPLQELRVLGTEGEAWPHSVRGGGGHDLLTISPVGDAAVVCLRCPSVGCLPACLPACWEGF